MQGESLFTSAHSALVFAFNFSGQSYDRPVMNRMADEPRPAGKGLSGLDGAGQAGMIRSEVKAMGKLAEAILIARHAPQTTPCQCRAACCSGYRANKEWINAVAYLADHMRSTALAGCIVNGLMRREYVVRYFTKREQRTSIEALAETYGIDRHTVSAHASKVMAWLGGTQGKKDRPAMPGMETAAVNAIEERMREIGMVGA